MYILHEITLPFILVENEKVAHDKAVQAPSDFYRTQRYEYRTAYRLGNRSGDRSGA